MITCDCVAGVQEDDEGAGDVVLRSPEEIAAVARCCDCAAGMQEEDEGAGDVVVRSPEEMAVDAATAAAAAAAAAAPLQGSRLFELYDVAAQEKRAKKSLEGSGKKR